MMRHVLFLLAVVGAIAACHAMEPSNKAIDVCMKKCNDRASRQCSEHECERGCEFVLDRILEREADHVVTCVSRQSRRCADVVWAQCAATVGPHADGGPPGPPPPQEDWEQ